MFPLFTVERMVESASKGAVGAVAWTVHEGETWVGDRWTGLLKAGTRLIAGRWRRQDGLLVFLLAPWSQQYYPSLKSTLQKEAIAFFTRQAAPESRGVREFLFVPTGKDVTCAGDLSRLILREVL